MSEEFDKVRGTDSAKERLRLARERSQKSPEEVAWDAGINTPSYYDLEWVDGTIESGAPLRDLQKICAEVGIAPSDLFTKHPVQANERISFEELTAKLCRHVEASGQDIAVLESRIGFEIRQSLDNSASILDWDIECLRAVCLELGIDWKLALPPP